MPQRKKLVTKIAECEGKKGLLKAALDSIDHPKKKLFLEAFAKTLNVRRASRVAKVSRQAHYQWLDNDPRYRLACKRIRRYRIDQLEENALDRAIDGTQEPVFFKGAEIAKVQKFDNRLSMDMLRVHRRKYREALRSRDTTAVNVSTEIDQRKIVATIKNERQLSEDQLAKIDEVLDSES